VLACSALKESYRELLWSSGEVKARLPEGTYALFPTGCVRGTAILPASKSSRRNSPRWKNRTDAITVTLALRPKKLSARFAGASASIRKQRWLMEVA